MDFFTLKPHPFRGEGVDVTVPARLIWLLGYIRRKCIWVTISQPHFAGQTEKNRNINTDFSGKTWVVRKPLP